MMRFALLALLGGCSLYWNSDPPPPPDACPVYEAPPSDTQMRDPETGQCETISPDYCDPGCGPCPGGAGVGSNTADWSSCESKCLGMAESLCLATSGCQAEYLDNGTLSYWGCFATAPSGPVEGECTGLSAEECSRHDDCKMYYQQQEASWFEKCVDENPLPPPPPPAACDTLTTEASCTARTDCVPIYQGYNCTCDSSGCTCQTEVFEKCQAR